jgi:hypothetical protein
MIPTFNAAVPTGNGTFCKIVAADPSQQNLPYVLGGQGRGQMFSMISYYAAGGVSGVGTVLTFQELGADGAMRSMGTPAPITIVNSTNYSGSFNGPLHGCQIVLTNFTGGANGPNYIELKGYQQS